MTPQKCKNKGPSRGRGTRAKHRVQKREGDTSQAWSAHSFHCCSDTRKDCEEVEPSPNSEEKNLGSFKGLATHRLHGTGCGMANMELEFQLALKYRTRLYELTVCRSLDHNLHCHDHIRQLKSILIKMEILSPLFSFPRTLIFPQSGPVFSRSPTAPDHWKSSGRKDSRGHLSEYCLVFTLL